MAISFIPAIPSDSRPGRSQPLPHLCIPQEALTHTILATGAVERASSYVGESWLIVVNHGPIMVNHGLSWSNHGESWINHSP